MHAVKSHYSGWSVLQEGLRGQTGWTKAWHDRDPAPLADILAGMDSRDTVQVIPDRAAAIQRAIFSAASDDVILIAGKGHEQTQTVAGVSRPFSDLAVAAAALSGAQQGQGA